MPSRKFGPNSCQHCIRLWDCPLQRVQIKLPLHNPHISPSPYFREGSLHANEEGVPSGLWEPVVSNILLLCITCLKAEERAPGGPHGANSETFVTFSVCPCHITEGSLRGGFTQTLPRHNPIRFDRLSLGTPSQEVTLYICCESTTVQNIRKPIHGLHAIPIPRLAL